LTAYSLRSRAGFVSHRRRSWDSPFGAFSSRKVSMRFRLEEPTYRFTRRYTRASPGRHDRLRFLGFDPSGNPWRPNMLLTRRPLDAPLGLLQPHPRPQQAASPREATRFRGLCTGLHPSHSTPAPTGICVHLAQRHTLLCTAYALWSGRRSTGAVGIGLRCRASRFRP
jgi:hypothetical protein